MNIYELRVNSSKQQFPLCRQEKERKLILVLDCLDSGLANVDMEFINILLGTLKAYYPEVLRWILIYEMPWIMNGEFIYLLQDNKSALTFQ